MVAKGEYMILDENPRKTSGYVFMDYRLGGSVFHFSNLVIGTNIQLQKKYKRSLHKVSYFLPHAKHERLIETIRIKEDLIGLLK